MLSCALSSKRCVKINSRKNPKCHFWASSSEKNPKYRSSDLQSDCNSKRSIKPDTSGQMWSVEWSSFFTVVSKIAIWEKERERKKGDHLQPLQPGKWKGAFAKLPVPPGALGTLVPAHRESNHLSAGRVPPGQTAHRSRQWVGSCVTPER